MQPITLNLSTNKLAALPTWTRLLAAFNRKLYL